MLQLPRLKIRKTRKRIQDFYLSINLVKDLVPEAFHLTEAALGIGTGVHKVRVGYGELYSPRDNVVDSFNSLHKARDDFSKLPSWNNIVPGNLPVVLVANLVLPRPKAASGKNVPIV